jgi:hypothetical protein
MCVLILLIYDAWLLHDAIEGLGTNDEQLIGI